MNSAESSQERPDIPKGWDRELWGHCFSCGGPADFKMAGDAWCHRCNQTAHYCEAGPESSWEPTWLIGEVGRLKGILEAYNGGDIYVRMEPKTTTSGVLKFIPEKRPE